MTLDGLLVHPSGNEDPRRKIVDVTPRIKVFTVADAEGLQLGNHYHAKTPEWYYVHDGKLLVKLEDIRTKQRRTYEVSNGEKLELPLYVAHLVIPHPRTIFLGILEADFDPKDLLEYKIVW